LVGNLCDLDAYRHYLVVSSAFRTSIELELKPESIFIAQLGMPLLVGELQRDCEDLGLTAPAATEPLDLLPDGDQQLGALYVLEGSMLGAHMLLAQAEQLGLESQYGARHLAKQVAMAGRWKCFLKYLENAESFELDAGIAGACKTFNLAISIAEAYRGAGYR